MSSLLFKSHKAPSKHRVLCVLSDGDFIVRRSWGFCQNKVFTLEDLDRLKVSMVTCLALCPQQLGTQLDNSGFFGIIQPLPATAMDTVFLEREKSVETTPKGADPLTPPGFISDICSISKRVCQ